MGSAPKCIFSLLFISYALFLFNSQLISTSDNHRCNNGVSNNHILSKYRSLLSLESHNSRTKAHHHLMAVAPSPAPSQEVRKPLRATAFHAKTLAPRFSHHAPAMSTQSYSNEKHGSRKTIAITISVTLVLVIATIFALLFLLCKRPKGKKTIHGKSKIKVSFDPGLAPEAFYVNSLTHFIDIHDSNHVKVSNETMQIDGHVISSPLYDGNEEVIVRCEGDYRSCSDEEETLSFHSARASVLSELPQHHMHANNSPSNSSSMSMSPVCGTNSKTIHQEVDAFQRFHAPGSEYSCEMRKPTISHPKVSFLNNMKSQLSSNALKSKGIPQKFALATENTSKTHNASTTDYPEMHLPVISPPRVSFISGSKIQLSKSNSPSNQSQNATFSSSYKVQSANTKPPRPPLPPPPPPPPPMQYRKKAMHQKPCNNGQSLPPPPSPMEQLEQEENDGSTLPKLKPLHWDKVRAAPDRSMVWDKIRSSSFEFDEKMMESLFGYNSKNALKLEEATNKMLMPSPTVHLLEHKRLQNITILLKALNATTHQVSHALTKGSGLSVQQLEALVKMVPTKEEEENLIKYQGDIEELDPAQKFVKVVFTIPFAFAKMEVMLYKETFQDEVSHLRNSFTMLEEACKELKSSKLFLRLLEAVLKTGNRMNIGTTRGGARAFKLDALLRLADVKGTDGRTTLLHFVVQEINKPKPEGEKELSGLDLVSGLSTELSNVKKTASVDLDVLIGSVQNLSLGFSKLKQLVQSDLCVDDLNFRFLQSMKEFMQNAEMVIKELKNEEREVLCHVREITEYYHGDLSKEEANPLTIFVIVRDFLGTLDRVYKEMRQTKMHSGAPQLVMLNR